MESRFDFDMYERKRRSDYYEDYYDYYEEFPLVAQLSTSIKINVIEAFSEQPNFEDKYLTRRPPQTKSVPHGQ